MEESPRVFRASLLFILNAYGAITVGLGGGALLAAYLAFLCWMHHPPQLHIWVCWLVLGSLVVSVLALFPGSLAVYSPLAVEIRPGVGLTLFGPFLQLFIPMSEVLDIEKSSYTPGDVVLLARSHGIIKQFLIHRFFGPQREELIRVIRSLIDYP